MHDYLVFAWMDTLVWYQRDLLSTRILYFFRARFAIILVQILSYSRIHDFISFIPCHDHLTAAEVTPLCYSLSNGDGSLEPYLDDAYLRRKISDRCLNFYNATSL